MAGAALQPQGRAPPGQPDGCDHWRIAAKPEKTGKEMSKNEEVRRRRRSRRQMEQIEMTIQRVFALLFHHQAGT